MARMAGNAAIKERGKEVSVKARKTKTKKAVGWFDGSETSGVLFRKR